MADTQNLSNCDIVNVSSVTSAAREDHFENKHVTNFKFNDYSYNTMTTKDSIKDYYRSNSKFELDITFKVRLH